MSVLAEAAAAAADRADRSQPGHLGIELGVKLRAARREMAAGSRSPPSGADSVVDHHFRDHGQGCLDLGDRVHPALTGPGADLADAVPGPARRQVLRPERPGTALIGPRVVDGAAGLLIPEDAVAARLLDQAEAVVRPAGRIARRRFRRVSPRNSAIRRISSIVTQT